MKKSRFIEILAGALYQSGVDPEEAQERATMIANRSGETFEPEKARVIVPETAHWYLTPTEKAITAASGRILSQEEAIAAVRILNGYEEARYRALITLGRVERGLRARSEDIEALHNYFELEEEA